MKLTGAEIVVEHLIAQGCQYIIGIPGHGNLALTDALRRRESEITVIQAMHESAAVHMADGYYRATGQPLAVFTSIGPGALNTIIGLANAYVDSTAVLALTGDTHVHMAGRGVLQEIERRQSADNFRALEPVVKRAWRITDVAQLPNAMQRAFNHMRSGRPGPTAINLPMDVQAASADVELPTPVQHLPGGVPQGDPAQVEQAVELLARAKRPVILVGGGVITANASQALRKVAEASGAAVVNTMMGIGAFPADHPLYGWATGSKGTSCGLQLTAQADVLLAVGCRFADETASSYRRGVSFSIPPTKLIHVDLDPAEIGKNYPVTVGIVGDARAVLEQIAEALGERGASDYASGEYFAQIQQFKREWIEKLAAHRDDSKVPVMISTVLQRLRPLLDRDAIVVTSSGNVQAQIIQEFEFYQPRTCLTAGGFSTMGFTLPAALGAKLAAPDRQVVGLVGDGDFMMHMQELSTAVRYNLPVVIIILNNSGWISIRDLQMAVYGEQTAFATDFTKANGEYSPHLADIAQSFGCHGQRISRAEEIEPAVRAALQAERPAVIEVLVNRQFPYTGTPAVGWWDVPVPGYFTERRAQYESERGEESLR